MNAAGCRARPGNRVGHLANLGMYPLERSGSGQPRDHVAGGPLGRITDGQLFREHGLRVGGRHASRRPEYQPDRAKRFPAGHRPTVWAARRFFHLPYFLAEVAFDHRPDSCGPPRPSGSCRRRPQYRAGDRRARGGGGTLATGRAVAAQPGARGSASAPGLLSAACRRSPDPPVSHRPRSGPDRSAARAAGNRVLRGGREDYCRGYRASSLDLEPKMERWPSDDFDRSDAAFRRLFRLRRTPWVGLRRAAGRQ